MINFSGQFRGDRRAVLAIAALIALGCGSAAHPAGDRPAALVYPDRLWVLAPHPDDEVLMAGELLRAAVQSGRLHTVVVMTNGDLGCERDGHARQLETLAALAELGVRESDVRFLGYPDGWLDALGPVPLDPLPRTQADGSCGLGDHTYASHGADGTDVHTARTGEPGAYVVDGPTDDLAWLLAREHPTEIVTAHGIDTHPDHAMTYVHLQRALTRSGIEARVLRSVVHQGPCWPNGAGVPPCPDVRLTQGTAFPPFAAPLATYRPSVRIASVDGGALLRRAIAHYTTQLETPVAEESWLASFARTEEVFWPDPAQDEDAPSVVVEASFATGATLTLGAITLTIDSEGATLRESDALLRRIPIPHGESASTMHVWSLQPLGVEVVARRDADMWMLAVSAARLTSGTMPRSTSASGKHAR